MGVRKQTLEAGAGAVEENSGKRGFKLSKKRRSGPHRRREIFILLLFGLQERNGGKREREERKRARALSRGALKALKAGAKAHPNRVLIVSFLMRGECSPLVVALRERGKGGKGLQALKTLLRKKSAAKGCTPRPLSPRRPCPPWRTCLRSAGGECGAFKLSEGCMQRAIASEEGTLGTHSPLPLLPIFLLPRNIPINPVA